jgi:oligosaccharide reducing-end xylanase
VGLAALFLLGAVGLALGCSSLDLLGTRPEASVVGTTDSPAPEAPPVPAPTPLPNVLEEREDVPLSEVNAKLNAAFLQLFFGDPATEAVYFEVGDGTAYVADIASGDVRTDSMAYGMLVTVELDQREVFDQLWAWARQHMRRPEGPGAGLLDWRCEFDGSNCGNSGATDAMTVIASTLLIASRRFGASGRHDYRADALGLLESMTSIEARNGGVVDGVVNCFSPDTALPRLGSLSPAAEVPVDYLMPAFYALFGEHDAPRAEFWGRAAAGARDVLDRVPEPTSGLLPGWVSHEGTPLTGRDAYGSTTSRALFNLALDQLWFGSRALAVENTERLLDFFLAAGVDGYVAEYERSGAPRVDFNTTAHRALVALAAGTSDDPRYDPFLEALLSEPIPTGTYRYYDGMLYILSLLALSGQLTAG